jgi:hypothetical protein
MFSVCVCAFFCVCVQVGALPGADHLRKESYRSETEKFPGGRPRPKWGCWAKKMGVGIINGTKANYATLFSCFLITYLPKNTEYLNPCNDTSLETKPSNLQ